MGQGSIVPLHLTGNTTEVQNARLLTYLGAAAQEGCRLALGQLDQNRAQIALDFHQQVQAEVVSAIADIVLRHAVTDRFKDEQVPSNRKYPTAYKIRPIDAQVSELRKLFPSLGNCMEKLGRLPLPEGAEAWFAIPRWQALGPTYNEAIEAILRAVGARRRLSNRVIGRMSSLYLRQSERTMLAEKLLADQQPGKDILVLAVQAGMRHRGCSARRARVTMAGNEFGLGAFAVAAILLTHPERLSAEDTLMIDCAGDEYSFRGDATFDRVPLFDFDMAGLEFSIFYEDRSRNLWGTPSGFLYKVPEPPPKPANLPLSPRPNV